MENNTAQQDRKKEDKGGFAAFLIKRVVVVTLLILIVLWALATGIDYLDKPAPWKDRLVKDSTSPQTRAAAATPAHNDIPATANRNTPAAERAPHASRPMEVQHQPLVQAAPAAPAHSASADQGRLKAATEQPSEAARVPGPADHGSAPPPSKTAPASPATGGTSDQGGHPAAKAPAPPAAIQPKPLAKGVAFLDAVVKPLEHELSGRFWGWRPNDILNVTDNVNNYQLGVLEVTRRAVVQLTERISRTGSTDTINRELENAMNWLMIKADSYWFPSPEAKYKESLAELKAYRDELAAGSASFYTRADNIIPLLGTFEDLLGSCDENLVKTKEQDGSTVGFFRADNYFYYAKGVAAAMGEILEAVAHDFEQILLTRHGDELLHHAIVSCRLAASLDPWLVTNAPLDGILANHRAHMAAPISHARYYIGQLVKTLST